MPMVLTWRLLKRTLEITVMGAICQARCILVLEMCRMTLKCKKAKAYCRTMDQAGVDPVMRVRFQPTPSRQNHQIMSNQTKSLAAILHP
uniref:Putative secreted protein n=1 Tax=Ixodes ricinus TaxID=34613 RepID=A0A6B0UAJ2_IXORI